MKTDQSRVLRRPFVAECDSSSRNRDHQGTGRVLVPIILIAFGTEEMEERGQRELSNRASILRRHDSAWHRSYAWLLSTVFVDNLRQRNRALEAAAVGFSAVIVAFFALGNIAVTFATNFRKLLISRKARVSNHDVESLRNDQIPILVQAIFLLVEEKSREYLLGDLREEYLETILPFHGRFSARLWWWGEAFAAVWPYIWKRTKRVLKLGRVWEMQRR